MKNFILLISATAMLAACSQAEKAEEPLADAPVTADPGGHGAVLVSLPDGAKVLNVSTADGVHYSGELEREPGAWTVEGDKSCLDPAGEEPKFCFTAGPVQDDGSWQITQDDGQTATVNRIDTGDAGANVSEQAGSYLVTFADGTTGLVVWTSDGREYFAPAPQKGTWRVADGKRCGKLDSETVEACSTPGVIAKDGSWTGTPDDPERVKVNVMPLS